MRTIWFLLLVGCTSNSRLAPETVTLHGGQSWYNVNEASWNGPSVGVSLGWALGPRARSYEHLEQQTRQAERTSHLLEQQIETAGQQRVQAEEQTELLEDLNDRQKAVLDHSRIPDPVKVEVHQNNLPGQLADTSPGALGIPNGVWIAFILCLVAGALAIAKKAGVRLPLLGNGKPPTEESKRPG